MRYNDYEKAVYGYLKNYNRFIGQIKNLSIEIQGIEEQIKSLGDPKTPTLTDMPHGGNGELSPVERAYERKAKLEAQLPVLAANRQQISTLVQRVDHAISLLGEKLQEIVREKFIDGRQWEAVALKTNYSERRCREIAAWAVRDITRTMFPGSSDDPQMELDFTFIESK